MRLINTTTLEFEEQNYQLPEWNADRKRQHDYAILSHRWGEKEVSYSDYLEQKQHASPGYAKIVAFCRLAKANGFDRVWVDTCCIDKKSSAELSESVNSMYNWYSWSRVCYVYLADVPSASHANIELRMKAFRESEWWTRGWTLQELLGPHHIEFYDREWYNLGTKLDLLDTIAEITGIVPRCLKTPARMFSESLATRMSWASQRRTTKAEDIAYCLFGLFGVNMPLLYGEGAIKAFRRLQEEIIKKTDDNSIFAWEDHLLLGYDSTMLARGPYCFAKSRNFRSNNLDRNSGPTTVIPLKPKPFSMTNLGLKIRFPSKSDATGARYVLLQCCKAEKCDRCLPYTSEGRRKSPDNPGPHQWLAIKVIRYAGGLWLRKSLEVFVVDRKDFTEDDEAMYVV